MFYGLPLSQTWAGAPGDLGWGPRRPGLGPLGGQEALLADSSRHRTRPAHGFLWGQHGSYAHLTSACPFISVEHPGSVRGRRGRSWELAGFGEGIWGSVRCVPCLLTNDEISHLQGPRGLVIRMDPGQVPAPLPVLRKLCRPRFPCVSNGNDSSVSTSLGCRESRAQCLTWSLACSPFLLTDVSLHRDFEITSKHEDIGYCHRKKIHCSQLSDPKTLLIIWF